MKLLHIDCSILGAKSVSHMLTAEIVNCQKTLYPGIMVAYRDLAADPALRLSAARVAAWAGGAVEGAVLSCDLETGQDYLSELFEADIVVIGAPMYNFSVPSQLKAWIDRIVVAGQTFEYSESGELLTFLPPSRGIYPVFILRRSTESRGVFAGIHFLQTPKSSRNHLIRLNRSHPLGGRI